ncbi:uncharacterized protein LOC122017284 [Zingiber officinale]|uniref:uncharacterized protein LOC122017284 n=1 Tax=Zingiber officinale TaxID=94328 RepID=UPI001C4CE966|nr:uncharacterized protein LOC122017284 [Zingiber officinale]
MVKKMRSRSTTAVAILLLFSSLQFAAAAISDANATIHTFSSSLFLSESMKLESQGDGGSIDWMKTSLLFAKQNQTKEGIPSVGPITLKLETEEEKVKALGTEINLAFLPTYHTLLYLF